MLHLPQSLNVPLMDEDHAVLDAFLDNANHAQDADLPQLFEDIRREIALHFAREEQLMQKHDVPVYACHVELHAALLEQADLGRGFIEAGDMASLRIHLGSALPHLISQHIATADTVSAGFIRGDHSAFARAG